MPLFDSFNWRGAPISLDEQCEIVWTWSAFSGNLSTHKLDASTVIKINATKRKSVGAHSLTRADKTDLKYDKIRCHWICLAAFWCGTNWCVSSATITNECRRLHDYYGMACSQSASARYEHICLPQPHGKFRKNATSQSELSTLISWRKTRTFFPD